MGKEILARNLKKRMMNPSSLARLSETKVLSSSTSNRTNPEVKFGLGMEKSPSEDV
jgi:hypothetical protein